METFSGNENQYSQEAQEILQFIGRESDQGDGGVLSEAVRRIEEANLFKTLIKQDIFTNDSADADIVLSVNNKIKKFAEDELKRLLGFDTPQTVQQVNVSDFDKEEVEALKAIASKLLKREAPAVIKDRNPTMNPVITTQARTVKTSVPQTHQQPALNQYPQDNRPKQVAKSTPKITGSVTKSLNRGIAKPIPQPTSDQALMHFGGSRPPGMVLGGDPVSQNVAQSLAGAISSLTGGNLVHVDNTNPADLAGNEDINGRF